MMQPRLLHFMSPRWCVSRLTTLLSLIPNLQPDNAAVFPPGPALIFAVVNGVPSIGLDVMIGNGIIGTQPTDPVAELPLSSGFSVDAETVQQASTSNHQNGSGSSDSSAMTLATSSFLILLCGAVFALFA